MRFRQGALALSAAVAILWLISWAVKSPIVRDAEAAATHTAAVQLDESVIAVDAFFERQWQAEGVTTAEPADDLQVLRRLSLVLHGTVPSLEMIRQFQSDERKDRLRIWTASMLADKRFADYFAERLARAYVGTEGGQFIVYRRDRFRVWLSEQLAERRPYDEIVKEMIAGTGLWTGRPETNFVTAAVVDGDIDENKLAGRVARSFLGQRIDCAQCHDHPFADWKQAHFEGLAAYFGGTGLSPVGIEDKADKPYVIKEDEDDPGREVAPQVPFDDALLPKSGTRREQLAAWVTHPENRRFERATVNRVWGLMFGRPFFNPVDDLPDPGEFSQDDLLDVLGEDFRQHGYDLRRLIQVIAASRPFRVSSEPPSGIVEADDIDHLESVWALFPMTRLRPEQLIGAMAQCWNLKTVDQNSHLVTRFVRYFREQDFVREYGDLGPDELDEQPGTVPQALLRMNGEFSKQMSEATPFAAAGRIAGLASGPENLVETAYLVCLTRLPEPAEAEHFVSRFAEADRGKWAQLTEDMFWVLFNSPEFSWNH